MTEKKPRSLDDVCRREAPRIGQMIQKGQLREAVFAAKKHADREGSLYAQEIAEKRKGYHG